MALDAAAEKSLAAERTGAPVRVGVVALLVAHLALAPPPTVVPWLAWPVLAVGAVFAVGVALWVPARTLALRRSRLTSSLDAVLITLFLGATGGLHSPYYLLWYVSIIGVAFRYDLRLTVAGIVACSGLYLGLLGLLGQWAVAPDAVALRLGFLVLVGVLSGVFAQAAYGETAARLRALEELQSANERLRQLDQLKTQFLNKAAHELNTPLTPMRLQLALLRARPGQPVSPEALGLLERSADRLKFLAGDLLDVARIEAGRLKVERHPVELGAVLEAVGTQAAPRAAERGVDLEVVAAADLWVAADEPRLAQVVTNLVDNALQSTPEGGRVRLEAGGEGGRAVVAVTDTGAGLAAEDLPRLFQAFAEREAQGAAQRPGSGLGLYIAKGIVEQHGGALWAESAGVGQGATFAFSLPLVEPPANAVGREAHPERGVEPAGPGARGGR